jgi:hypothetical protein
MWSASWRILNCAYYTHGIGICTTIGGEPMYFNTVAPPSQSGIPKFVQGTGLEVVDYVSVGTISTKMLIYIAYY